MTPERFDELKALAERGGLTRSQDVEVIAELARLRDREPVAWQCQLAGSGNVWGPPVIGDVMRLPQYTYRPLYAGDPIVPPKPPLEPVYRGAITVYEIGDRTAIVAKCCYQEGWFTMQRPGTSHTFVTHENYETRAEAETEAAAWCQRGGE